MTLIELMIMVAIGGIVFTFVAPATDSIAIGVAAGFAVCAILLYLFVYLDGIEKRKKAPPSPPRTWFCPWCGRSSNEHQETRPENWRS